jgi:hypothetical protein
MARLTDRPAVLLALVVALLAATAGPVAAFKAEDFKVGQEEKHPHACVWVRGRGASGGGAGRESIRFSAQQRPLRKKLNLCPSIH